MGDVSAWVAIGLTGLALLGGCVAYMHTLMGQVHTRISASRDWAEEKVKEAKQELTTDLATEREERRREHDRLEAAIDSFGNVSTAVTALVEGVRHLGDRFEDHRKFNDRGIDELKHQLRQMDSRIQSIAGVASARRD